MHRFRNIANLKMADDVLGWLNERGLYDPQEFEGRTPDVADILTEYETKLRGDRRAEGFPNTRYPAASDMRRHDAIMGAVASLAAAISLLERTPRAKKSAPSDRMFDQMLADYRKALDAVRAELLSRPSSPGSSGEGCDDTEMDASPKP